MTVKVAFFAGAKEVTGCDFIDLELDESATIATVQFTLLQSYPDLALILEQSAWSVDHEYVHSDQLLYHGAEVGLIPPVSGG